MPEQVVPPPPRPDAIRSQSRRLVDTYTAIRLGAPEDRRGLEMVRRSAWFLEYLAFGTAGLEIATETLSVTSWEELGQRFQEWCLVTETFTGIEFSRLSRETGFFMREYLQAQEALPSPVVMPLQEVLNLLCEAARLVTDTCPISQLEELAQAGDQPELGARCRHAYSLLRQHVHRQRLDGIGRAYAEGRLSLREVENILESSIHDVLAWLDERGFSRSMERIRLSDDQRSEILQRMRQDRLRRQGEPEFDQELVDREVMASQRIEGVDARRWLAD